MSAPPKLDSQLVRGRFNAAASVQAKSGVSDYATAAVVQREVGNRLLERFDFMKLTPQTILDVGCGPGTHSGALRARFPNANVVAIDHARAMVDLASPAPSGILAKLSRQSRDSGVVADMAKLPIKHGVADVLWSNFALQWANDLPALFAEWNRAVKVDGVLMFTMPGPDTLIELRRAVTQALPSRVSSLHVHTDLHDIGDMLVHAGFADPVMDMEVITLEYKTTDALWRDLRAQGAMSAVASRAHGCLSPHAWARLNDALNAQRDANGMIRISVEVVYGHAWKVPPKKTADGHGI
ncbi:MAG: methyltransferase domain-containing protein, partial [Burkholderiales bacterium]